MTETKNYSDAVIAEAARQVGWSPDAINDELARGDQRAMVICDLLAERMPDEPSEPEVDPVLIEAVARLEAGAKRDGWNVCADQYRLGKLNSDFTTLVAIDLINERNEAQAKAKALQAELDALRLERDNLQKTRNALLEELTPLRNTALTSEFPEPKPLDPHAPLEARHKDGRVVPVELGYVNGHGSIAITFNPDVQMKSGFPAIVFRKDGTHHSGEWTLRNRVQP